MYTKEFVLHGGDAAFADRHKALFERLSMAEKQCNKDKDTVSSSYIDTEIIDERIQTEPRAGQKRKRETQRLRGKESIFKRPEGPAPRSLCRNVSNHHRYPHKWTKYSLDDVSNEDMSDKSNTQAALSFLQELKARKVKDTKNEEKMDTDDQCGNKIVFNKQKKKPATQIQFKKTELDTHKPEQSVVVIDKDDKPIFRSSKIIMPEYVIGQKQKKKEKKNRPIIKVDRSKELKLDHLNELDEDEV